jgi:hypothetical protein
MFQNLMLAFFSCTIIAVLIVVAVIASHKNVNTAFPGEVNALNKSDDDSAAGAPRQPGDAYPNAANGQIIVPPSAEILSDGSSVVKASSGELNNRL